MIKVLVVDDEPGIVEALGLALSGHGYDVKTAANGTRALEAIDNCWKPDFVLSDWMMPTMDGAALARALRAQPSLAGTTIFLMSALVPDGSLPLDGFLQKPFSMQALLRLIERHCVGTTR